MTTANMEDLFSKIDSISDDIKVREEKDKERKTNNNNNNTDFKNVDISFLNGVMGNYEFRLLSDSSGEFSDVVWMHSIPTTPKKTTVVCSGKDADGNNTCEICNLRNKIDEAQIKQAVPKDKRSAWRYNRYKLNKILIKTGDVPDTTKGLKENTVYLCYVDDKFFNGLISSLQTNRKYYSDDILNMMNHKVASAGFLMTAAKVKKNTSYNFQFIQQIKIEGFNPKDVFGIDAFKISTQGMFRNNYIHPKKLETAVSFMTSALLKVVEEAPAPKVDEKKEPEPKPEVKEEPKDISQDPTPELKTDFKEEKVEHPATTQQESSVSDKSIVIHNPDILDEDTKKPLCFAHFDPNNPVCTKNCTEPQRECIGATF